MNESTCEVPRCPELSEARDLCRTHYQRWYRHGDPLALMRPPATGGIYRINGPEGRVYIGSSDNVRRRWKSHKSQLRRSEHHNGALQLDWNELGESAFTFALLEEIADPARLVAAEQRHLDAAKAAGLAVYNIAADIRSPGRGIAHTDAAKLKMGAAASAWLADPANRDHVRAQRAGERNAMSKLNDARVREICERLLAGNHPKQVAAEFHVTQETVYQIRSGRTWKHVVPPETVTAMLAIRQDSNVNRVFTDADRTRMAAVGRSNKGRKLPGERVAQISEKARGAGNPKAKVSEDDVRAIRRLVAAKVPDEDLAAQFGLSVSNVSKIRRRETWAHIN